MREHDLLNDVEAKTETTAPGRLAASRLERIKEPMVPCGRRSIASMEEGRTSYKRTAPTLRLER
jgi:hypothetical protein